MSFVKLKEITLNVNSENIPGEIQGTSDSFRFISEHQLFREHFPSGLLASFEIDPDNSFHNDIVSAGKNAINDILRG